MKPIGPAIAAVVLVATAYAAAMPIGPVPPLGDFLDPAHGILAAGRQDRKSNGEIRIPGTQHRVEVVFDDRAVPHIFAQSDEDAYRALGYIVARDRLFQMELQTRATAGTLAELVGARALPADTAARHLALAWGAERNWAALDTMTRSYRAMRAYSDGVNAWIAAMRPADLPMEYRLLNARPMRWEPRYTIYFLARMGLTLAYNDATLRRLRVQAMVGSEAADRIVPINNPIQEPIVPNGTDAPRRDLRPLPAPGRPDSAILGSLEVAESINGMLAFGKREENGDGVGSNNWAVAPKRSASGHALLSGDPHLELTLPSIWYEAHLSIAGAHDVAGVTFPGMPGIVIGFNRDVAWTFTNAQNDVHDFYLETVDDSVSPKRYMLDGSWTPLTAREEIYRGKKGEKIFSDTVYFTHRGPMRRFRGRWLSMRWTVLEPSKAIDGFLGANRATDVGSWLTAMEAFTTPTQNGLVADTRGSIALRATGSYPILPGNGRGDIVRDGSLRANDWKGFIPLAQQPFTRDPAQGFIASANQQPIDPNRSGAYLGSDWYPPWRAMRINELLRADSAVTPDAMRRFHTDAGSPRADAFVPHLLAAGRIALAESPADSALAESLRVLARWDRKYRTDSREAALFELTMDEVNKRAWDELPGKFVPSGSVLLELMSDPESKWWDRRSTAKRERMADIVGESLRAARKVGIAKYGSMGGERWTWSRVVTANIMHPLRSKDLSRTGIAVQGGPATLGPMNPSGTQGASWRMVVELAPQIRAWGTYPGGQSGNPASSRYADRVPGWARGELDEILFPRSARDIPESRVGSRMVIRADR